MAAPPSEPHVRTLAVDCGGGGIKASVLDAQGTMHVPPMRVPTPYPLPPDRLVATIADLAAQLPPADRGTVGMPGMLRHGVVIATPHYVTRSGPGTRVLPELLAAWAGTDMAALVGRALGYPVLVLNDAEVHGAGVISGGGLELVLTLGTGLGSAVFDGGVLAPHLELSHAPVRRGVTYDMYLGEAERRRLGDAAWSRRVRRALEGLRPVFRWDRLYVGGGNSRRIRPAVLEALGDDVVIVPNSAGIVGGVRAWGLRRTGE
ncbi:ROK family protein [Isoptericola sp. b441]|uniref:ROK family protein n=1 Tax=Actinotalea lenta TaxID=3064654 RepID=A0ABT9D6N7_9CELL|nr:MULTISPECIES: ROK family protein [unclassified Isoptericola]MDO8105698.1 ROK family protein [Isoptericola sp. b441]MDO8122403.1 ROK family protein [Isoptericola sp. b490]